VYVLIKKTQALSFIRFYPNVCHISYYIINLIKNRRKTKETHPMIALNMIKNTCVFTNQKAK
jgi:hypothetical protein